MLAKQKNDSKASIPDKDSGYKGYLKKKGKLGFYNKIFCVFKDKEFQMFKITNLRKPDSVIPINQDTTIQVVNSTSDGKVLKFIVGNSEDNTATLTSCDGKEDEMLKWILLLRSATYDDSKVSMDDFDIISVIGRGYYGKVMLVQKKDTKQLYAIKTIHKDRLVQSKNIYTVLRERNILAKARNPFLVSLYYAFQTDTKFYLVLEYVPGGELFHRLQTECKIPVNQVRLYIAEVAIALNYLHSIGIVYRDLKPENILISPQGHIKLTDFGLSKDLDNDDKTNTFCGTPEYASPEVIKRDYYGKEIDWWAVGVLTFELLYGRLPFESKNKAKLFYNILNKEPAFPFFIDQTSASFIKMLLVKDPKMRAGFKQIKRHPFMKDIDFDAVAQLHTEPEFIPQIEKDPLRQIPQNFDSDVLKELPIDSVAHSVASSAQHFNGFSFVANKEDSD